MRSLPSSVEPEEIEADVDREAGCTQSSNLYDTHALARPLLRFFIPPSHGSYSSLFALTSPRVVDDDLWGEYLVPFAKVKEPRNGKDEKSERELWEVCEAVVREKVGGV